LDDGAKGIMKLKTTTWTVKGISHKLQKATKQLDE
jgi:hypothetical protein